MEFKFTSSADRHNIPHADAKYAVENHVGFTELVSRRSNTRTFMFVGLPHPAAMRYLEVGVTVDGHGRRIIFHAMEVTDLYRDLIPSNLRERNTP